MWYLHAIEISNVNISQFKTAYEPWYEICNSNKKCQFGVLW